MPGPRTLLILAAFGGIYLGVHKVKHPVNVAAHKTAHAIVHVVTLGKK